MTFGGLKFNRAFHSLWSVEYPEVKGLIPIAPQHVRGPFYLQCIVHPIDESVRSGAAKLCLQFVFVDLAIVRGGKFLYVIYSRPLPAVLPGRHR